MLLLFFTPTRFLRELAEVEGHQKAPTHRVGARNYLVTCNNSAATRQSFDCHHQLLLFVLIMLIPVANMCTNRLLKKLF